MTNVSIWLMAILAVTAVYQSVDLGLKKRLARQIDRVLSPETIEYSYTNGDRPHQLPVQLSQVALTVEWLDDEVYGLYADDDWESLFPFGRSGFVTLGPNQDHFAVGMYHQLHCLDVFRISYAAARAHALVYPGNGTHFDNHFAHCMNYIREMLLCNADPTLIPAKPTGTEGRYISRSIGVTHQCRDWTQLRQWVEKNMMEANRTGAIL
ncbi:unnamed protein product [Peniophora sp. CBMAI 1063]|nr:unnamed protein product [Peniophora sp. CBMAI 1063]